MKKILFIGSVVQSEQLPLVQNRFQYTNVSSFAEARAELGRDLFDLIISEKELKDGSVSDFIESLKQSPLTQDVPVLVGSTAQSSNTLEKGGLILNVPFQR